MGAHQEVDQQVDPPPPPSFTIGQERSIFTHPKTDLYSFTEKRDCFLNVTLEIVSFSPLEGCFYNAKQMFFTYRKRD